jgi:putative sugar O-methyltransferase
MQKQTKAFLKSITPPILVSVARRLSSEKRLDFALWWASFRSSDAIPTELRLMVDHYLSTADYRESSDYWNWLCRLNIEQIVAHGLGNFRQTVAKNYFTWVGAGFDTTYAQNLVREAGASEASAALAQIFSKHDLLTMDESVQYNLMTVLLYEYCCRTGGRDLLARIEEPTFGNPPAICVDGKQISQDLLNSLLEFMSVTKKVAPESLRNIIEVGAGSGRTAYCFLGLIPDVRYVVVDIPPALFISQSYLTSQFPERRAFCFRPFESFAQVADEFAAAKIAFLTPDQLPLLPEGGFDLFLAIDCLHEMKKSRVAYYFDQADRLTDNIYFKCWENTEIPFDNIVWTAADYPVKSAWRAEFKRPCKVPGGFFEALFKIK